MKIIINIKIALYIIKKQVKRENYLIKTNKKQKIKFLNTNTFSDPINIQKLYSLKSKHLKIY